MKNVRGPFFVRDKDFQDQQVYKLAECCKDCGFCDEQEAFCALSNCIYFDNYTSEGSDK